MTPWAFSKAVDRRDYCVSPVFSYGRGRGVLFVYDEGGYFFVSRSSMTVYFFAFRTT